MNKEEMVLALRSALIDVLNDSPANITSSDAMLKNMCKDLDVAEEDVDQIMDIVCKYDNRGDLLRVVVAGTLTPTETVLFHEAISNDLRNRAEDVKKQLAEKSEAKKPSIDDLIRAILEK